MGDNQSDPGIPRLCIEDADQDGCTQGSDSYASSQSPGHTVMSSVENFDPSGAPISWGYDTLGTINGKWRTGPLRCRYSLPGDKKPVVAGEANVVLCDRFLDIQFTGLVSPQLIPMPIVSATFDPSSSMVRLLPLNLRSMIEADISNYNLDRRGEFAIKGDKRFYRDKSLKCSDDRFVGNLVISKQEHGITVPQILCSSTGTLWATLHSESELVPDLGPSIEVMNQGAQVCLKDLVGGDMNSSCFCVVEIDGRWEANITGPEISVQFRSLNGKITHGTVRLLCEMGSGKSESWTDFGPLRVHLGIENPRSGTHDDTLGFASSVTPRLSSIPNVDYSGESSNSSRPHIPTRSLSTDLEASIKYSLSDLIVNKSGEQTITYHRFFDQMGIRYSYPQSSIMNEKCRVQYGGSFSSTKTGQLFVRVTPQCWIPNTVEGSGP